MPFLAPDVNTPLASAIQAASTWQRSILSDPISVYSFEGFLQSIPLETELQEIEDKIGDVGGNKRMKRRIIRVIIEAIQNTQHHGASIPAGKIYGQITLLKAEEMFSLMVSNTVLNKNGEDLENRIDDLNELDKSEIRKLFIEVLCNDDFSEKGGAGLGLLTMAKIADHPISHNLTSLEGDLSLFNLLLRFK